jgi:hypothetical protein
MGSSIRLIVRRTIESPAGGLVATTLNVGGRLAVVVAPPTAQPGRG